jgi:HK97 family phage prohead protease
MAAARASDLEYGHGSALWEYWTKGGGLAKWSGAVHKWTTLRDLLLAAGVPAHSADGLATNIIMAVMPGYMKLAHAKGRSGMDGADGERFNPNHVPGGAGGGQFTSGSGGGKGAAGKKPAARPAQKQLTDHEKHAAHMKHLASHPIGEGESGRRVSDLQAQLNKLGFGLKADGIFGPKTLAAVRAFQRGHKDAAGHPLKVDGLVGPKTMAALEAAPRKAASHGTGKQKGRSAMMAEAGLSITVNAPGADPAAVGKAVVDAVREYGRAAKPYGDVAYADPKNGKYPIDTADHAKAAWAYVNMPKNAAQYPMNGVTLAEVKKRIMAACKKFGIDVNEGSEDEANSAGFHGEERSAGGECVRSVPFELTSGGGDGLTLEGYAAVFNRTARITDRAGEFDEQIAPGAFAESLTRRKPVLMFEHGKHPLIGSMPLGRIDDIHEDEQGLYISARLSDNWLIQPVRDAVRDGAVNGMSFRFHSPSDEDQRWEKRAGQPDLRTLLRLDPPELGPVVFPAYKPTTAAIRSLLDELGEDFTGRVTARSGPGREHDVQPGHGRTSPTTTAALRERAWRMREIR